MFYVGLGRRIRFLITFFLPIRWVLPQGLSINGEVHKWWRNANICIRHRRSNIFGRIRSWFIWCRDLFFLNYFVVFLETRQLTVFFFNAFPKCLCITLINYFGIVKGANQLLYSVLHGLQNLSLLQDKFRNFLIFLVFFHFVVFIRLKLGMQNHLLVQIFAVLKGHRYVIFVKVRVLLFSIVGRFEQLSVLDAC